MCLLSGRMLCLYLVCDVTQWKIWASLVNTVSSVGIWQVPMSPRNMGTTQVLLEECP